MFSLIPKPSMWLVAALSVCFIATNSVLAGDDDDDDDGQRTKTVNCHRGNASVQSKIDKVKAGRDTTIFIVGFCDERVTIVKDGITLSGNKHGSGMIGGGLAEVTVTGAQRVQIEYLDITGAGFGVLAQEGASVMISNNNIYDNETSGVAVYYHSFARVESNTISGNGDFGGIEGFGSSNILSTGNLITGSSFAAIEVGNMSVFKSGRNTGSLDPADGDTIVQENCSKGDTAEQCADKNPDPNDVESYAIDCFRNCLIDMRNGNVTGLILFSGLSNFDVRNSTINGDVSGGGGSRLNLRNTITGSGFVSCGREAFASSSIQCNTTIPPTPMPMP